MKLEDELLVTLSFLEPMSLEYIFLDISSEFLAKNPELTTEDLQKSLQSLTKQKKIKKIKKQKQNMWIRLYPKKSLARRLGDIFKL